MAINIPPLGDAARAPRPVGSTLAPNITDRAIHALPPETTDKPATSSMSDIAPVEEQSLKAWIERFLERNEHLARPQPTSPPPSAFDGAPATWQAPEHLAALNPHGGYIAMHLISRMTDDLAELTRSKRAATYSEVYEYLGHALVALGVAPQGYTAEEATKWWRMGGSSVLQAAANDPHDGDGNWAELDAPTRPAALNGVAIDRWADLQTHSAGHRYIEAALGAQRAATDLAARYDPSSPWAAPLEPAGDLHLGGALDGNVADGAPLHPRISRFSLAGGEAPKPGAATKAIAQADQTGATRRHERPAAPLGTDLSTYDMGFGDKAHGFHGDYRTTPQARAWLTGFQGLAGPATPYPDGSPGNEKLSTKGRRKIREDVGYLYTLPEVKALLDLISETEGSAVDGYYRTHAPNKKRLPNLDTFHGAVPSGRYQIKRDNWENYGGAWWSRNDFSEITQDIIAITQLRHKGAIDQLMKGNLSGALSIAANIFASIPKSVAEDHSRYTKGYTDDSKGQSLTKKARKKIILDQPTPVDFRDLPARFEYYLKSRRAEFNRAEQAWKTSKILPKAFISPLRWRSFGLDGF